MQRLQRLFPKVSIATDEDRAKVTSPSTQMAIALAWKANRTGTPIYAGTVFGAVKAKRRAVGKRQRQARKLAR